MLLYSLLFVARQFVFWVFAHDVSSVGFWVGYLCFWILGSGSLASPEGPYILLLWN